MGYLTNWWRSLDERHVKIPVTLEGIIINKKTPTPKPPMPKFTPTPVEIPDAAVQLAEAVERQRRYILGEIESATRDGQGAVGLRLGIKLFEPVRAELESRGYRLYMLNSMQYIAWRPEEKK